MKVEYELYYIFCWRFIFYFFLGLFFSRSNGIIFHKVRCLTSNEFEFLTRNNILISVTCE